MTDYYRSVTLPALREAKVKLPRPLRRGLADGGRRLDDEKRARLQAWLAESPRMAQLAEFRAKLSQVLDERSHDAQATLARLQAWCAEAEASGNAALQAFSMRLKGYALAPARIGA
jgi:stearoyl-CoA desaturase (delta-9 desaturase)